MAKETLEHRGFTGSVEYSEEDGEFHGRVTNSTDVIHYSSESLPELQTEMAASVDFYLETCEKKGLTPSQT